MQVARIRSQQEYQQYKINEAEALKSAWLYEKKLAEESGGQPFTVKGFSYPAGEMVDFQVDYLYANGNEINWRERLICPLTGLNNRLRACIHLIDFELGLRPYHNIYIAEQVTPLYDYLIARYPKLIGSEYLGESFLPGTISDRGLRHESATELSFADASLDAYLSFECFEHIPAFDKCFTEAGRVVKPGGVFMWTVPFSDAVYQNVIRAVVDAHGEIKHLMPPEYHGDPVSEKGILCFTHFGWEMLEQVKNAGFSDAYALLYRSSIFGYMGNDQMLFIARKNMPGRQ